MTGAELISAVGTVGSTSLLPSRPDRPPPLGRPKLAPEVQSTYRKDLRRVQLARTNSGRLWV
ncbi:hypothetical protein Prudu_005781 [Prunus dulcis]|uniref:Uncharacterized protein n=1 Tax=Prunus dulcis TaxID=3755 RepID=A0A4Y1QYD7_PRUDU|nr:hypothetical protein Prudu_005781 [Prunus dulcis]